MADEYKCILALYTSMQEFNIFHLKIHALFESELNEASTFTLKDKILIESIPEACWLKCGVVMVVI